MNRFVWNNFLAMCMVVTYHLQNEHGTLRLWHKEITRGSTRKEEPKTNTKIQVKQRIYIMFKTP